ncbi:P-loop containing nucleoside triphosphate hydrolase protein [Hesseltinella vesiculosa]|uniref:P-loop containing nucleoside triphosphate hydrolase protein n=1 Tax=Hesseltinella vesiculosa TaxID=101127 RepID=A0A1X2GJT8_9FUNG|nr:P-loop containing nucleoside triphosphate hydrolase protein [Hesseltinella vesiculosa]
MPLPLKKYGSSFVQFIFYLLENATEETFWKSCLGERLYGLFQRYFGNDFVVITMIFYLAPILRTKWEDLTAFLYGKLFQRYKFLTVRVFRYDNVFNAVNNYVRNSTDQMEGMDTAMALYTKDKNNHMNIYESDDEDEPMPTVALYPMVNTINVIYYKGHKITVSQYADESVGGKRNTVDYLELIMQARNGETMDDFRQILQDWSNEFNKKEEKSEISLLSWNGYSAWDDEVVFKARPLDSIDLPKGTREMLVRDVERFMSSKAWYDARGISYHRGYLFWGPPGTGKSSLIQAMAGYVHMNIASMKLNEILSDTDLQSRLAKLPKKTLVVIEDIDHYQKIDNLSTTGLLNILDGLNSSEGTIVIMTCNNIEKVEPALLRPGRMDVKLKLDYALHSQIEHMFWRFFAPVNDTDVDADASLSITSGHLSTIKHEHASSTSTLILPPTPPVTLDDDCLEERNAFLRNALKQLLATIPEHTITTAELQSVFTSVSLENGPDAPIEDIIQSLLDSLPKFMDRVKEDREQAKKHAKKNKRRDEDDDKDSKGSDIDDNTTSTSDSQTDDKADTSSTVNDKDSTESGQEATALEVKETPTEKIEKDTTADEPMADNH